MWNRRECKLSNSPFRKLIKHFVKLPFWFPGECSRSGCVTWTVRCTRRGNVASTTLLPSLPLLHWREQVPCRVWLTQSPTASRERPSIPRWIRACDAHFWKVTTTQPGLKNRYFRCYTIVSFVICSLSLTHPLPRCTLTLSHFLYDDIRINYIWE